MYMYLSTATKQSILKMQSRVLTDYLMAVNMPSVFNRDSANEFVQGHWLILK